MPIHDWTRVDAAIFHDFHHCWVSTVRSALNQGILPPGYYALAERPPGIHDPGLLTRQGLSDAEVYAARANHIAVRHASDHRVVTVVEIVSPGDKTTERSLLNFAEKTCGLLRRGVHLMVVDLFPPGPRDPHGIHKVIWNELCDNDSVLPPERPLTLGSYVSRTDVEAFIEPTAVGAALPDMPLFLAGDVYVQLPLEAAYEEAFRGGPSYWQDVLEGRRPK